MTLLVVEFWGHRGNISWWQLHWNADWKNKGVVGSRFGSSGEPSGSSRRLEDCHNLFCKAFKPLRWCLFDYSDFSWRLTWNINNNNRYQPPTFQLLGPDQRGVCEQCVQRVQECEEASSACRANTSFCFLYFPTVPSIRVFPSPAFTGTKQRGLWTPPTATNTTFQFSNLEGVEFRLSWKTLFFTEWTQMVYELKCAYWIYKGCWHLCLL